MSHFKVWLPQKEKRKKFAFIPSAAQVRYVTFLLLVSDYKLEVSRLMSFLIQHKPIEQLDQILTFISLCEEVTY